MKVGYLEEFDNILCKRKVIFKDEPKSVDVVELERKEMDVDVSLVCSWRVTMMRYSFLVELTERQYDECQE